MTEEEFNHHESEENEEILEDGQPFEYSKCVDLHAMNEEDDLRSVVSIAAEHGFRGIVVPAGRIDVLVKMLNDKEYGDKEKRIMPIAAIDYPYGNLSTDIRSYAVNSARERGAKEIEIVVQYQFMTQGDKGFRMIFDDAQTISNQASKLGMSLKYVIDQNCKYVTDGVRTKLSRIMSATRVPIISTSLGFYDEGNQDEADTVIRMRTMKSKTGCEMKIYSSSCDVEDLASYVKAGVNYVGLDWKRACQIVHGYEAMIQKKS